MSKQVLFLIIASFFVFSLPALAQDDAQQNFFDFQNSSSQYPKEIKLSAGDSEETVSYEEYFRWFLIHPILTTNPGYKSEIENIYFCPGDKIECSLTLTYQSRLNIKRQYQSEIDHEAIQKFVEDIAKKVNVDPVDARFTIEEGRVSVFVPSQPGIAVNAQKSADIIEENIKKIIFEKQSIGTIKLAYDTKEPEVKASEINNLGINEVIGEGRSNFRGSPKNRFHNIQVGASRFNGVLIKPGEEFSFVKNLGEVDAEHGYAPELVIKKDKTEPEFGGGICQVSTTAFRAAIYSGLEITARRPHAYPVSYYNPQGMDATVYIPRPDLRFINNTPGYILIQTKIEGTELIFQFYGTNDGRKVEIIGPKITKKNPDGSMKATFTQNVYDKNGKQIINDVFNSSYDSPAKYPHPGEEKLTQKPSNWSDKEWKVYKKANGI